MLLFYFKIVEEMYAQNITMGTYDDETVRESFSDDEIRRLSILSPTLDIF